jgi:hypothetical protein
MSEYGSYAAFPEGARITVDGRFDRKKRVSGRTFYNEVTAATHRAKCRPSSITS